jgi:hypothetical protein
MTCGVRAAGLRAVLDSRLRGNDDWDRFFLAVIPAKAGIQRRAGIDALGYSKIRVAIDVGITTQADSTNQSV